MPTRELYIGLMSGTSLDAIDAVIIELSEHPHIIDSFSSPIPEDIHLEILALNSIQPNELNRSLVLGKKLAILFSETIKALLAKNKLSPEQIKAIGSHGQTLRHSPDGSHGYSLQIGDPSTLAELTNITVVADFRNRDIAAGGQGAPLVPAFHQAVFHSPTEDRAIINIGGMANISIFTKNDAILGFDTGPGNVLMDHWVRLHKKQPYDSEGDWARSGKVLNTLLDKMLDDEFFQLPPPKSTGREKFNALWLEQFNINDFSPEDIQATLLELTANSIVNALPEDIEQLFICGGGAKNTLLMERLQTLSKKPVNTTEILGIHPEWVEAAAFAWLAKQTISHIPGNLPEATGAKGPRILGGIYWAE